MNRALWLLGEIVLGLLLAGGADGCRGPRVDARRAGMWGPSAGGHRAWHQVSVLCVVVGERLRKTRQRDRLP